jgi:hypothetical protein
MEDCRRIDCGQKQKSQPLMALIKREFTADTRGWARIPEKPL